MFVKFVWWMCCVWCVVMVSFVVCLRLVWVKSMCVVKGLNLVVVFVCRCVCLMMVEMRLGECLLVCSWEMVCVILVMFLIGFRLLSSFRFMGVSSMCSLDIFMFLV